MLPIPKLNLGSIDAVNYKRRSEREFLKRIFFRDEYLDMILEEKRYFIIGEKGTGKTAYAALLNNTDYGGTLASLTNITETDYEKFSRLKSIKHYKVTDYVDSWKCVFLLLTAHHLIEKEANQVLGTLKFKALRSAIEEYYHNAFSPEVANALNLVEDSEATAELIGDHLKVSGGAQRRTERTGQSFQIHLLSIIRNFQESISTLNLRKNHIIFIDGIDIRPPHVSYDHYIECVKGLAQAAWTLNSEFFANIKGSKGRIKVVLLLRPDIFGSLGYQNPNAKILDNAVLLDWKTTYRDYRTSRIFKLIDGLFGKQQEERQQSRWELGHAWDHYFPYTVRNQFRSDERDNPFIGFLRYSLYRPRDIISYLLILKEYASLHQRDSRAFANPSFVACQSNYSDYLLGEVRDQLAFYYRNEDFEGLTQFFSYLGGRSHFSYEEFLDKYRPYQEMISRDDRNLIERLSEGPEAFLQLLYELNLVGYREYSGGNVFTHWCFRDRTTISLSPKVRYGVDYRVHPGLVRALDLGGRRGGLG